MKELSIEEKAKRYDEALEKARQLCAYPTSKPFISDLQDLFPELAESEDERIRKEITEFFKNYSENGTWKAIPDVTKWIAWIEKQKERNTNTHLPSFDEAQGTPIIKQGEQKSLDDVAKEITKNKETAMSFLKSCGIMNANGELADEYKIEQEEQKPAEWSEEDEAYRRLLIDIMDVEHRDGIFSINPEDISIFKSDVVTVKRIKDWLKSLKDRVQP